MGKYKFFYFPLRCRGELIRLLFHYANEKFEDTVIEFADWPNWKPNMPFGQLPVLEVDGQKISQSTAIGFLVARELGNYYAGASSCCISGLAGKTNWEQAVSHMYVEGVYEAWSALAPTYQLKFSDDRAAEAAKWKSFASDFLFGFLDRYQGFLGENDWLVGTTITWADFALADFLRNLEENFSGDVLAKHPKLKEFTNKVLALPQIKNYVDSRPKVLF